MNFPIQILCIHYIAPYKDCKPAIEGQSYTATEIINCKDINLPEKGDGYIIPELASEDFVYDCNKFIPLSDNDETERIGEILEKIFVKKQP